MKVHIATLAGTCLLLGFTSFAARAQDLNPSNPGTKYTAYFNADGSLKGPSNLVSSPARHSRTGLYEITFSVTFPSPPKCTYDTDKAAGASPSSSAGMFELTATGVAVGISGGSSISGGAFDYPFWIICQQS
ncbi:hypothetical protein [Luteibacter rhizovicinus]|uniref:hypothetical protein n=1 Tax=Luteibacter rhizovicinus TaxID=242606 RepID=UPI000AFC5D3B|nr:hypothetical protein [Luteibacter rhizovicinus]